MDIMIADLPHIQYNYKEKYTQKQEEDAMIITKKMQEEVKQKGIKGIKLLEGDDGAALLSKLKK